MLELKQKLSSGNLADFTKSVRRQLDIAAPSIVNWFDVLMAQPDMEASHITIKAARESGFYGEGQAPTPEQQHNLSYDEALAEFEKILTAFAEWNSRKIISDEEKKS